MSSKDSLLAWLRQCATRIQLNEEKGREEGKESVDVKGKVQGKGKGKKRGRGPDGELKSAECRSQSGPGLERKEIEFEARLGHLDLATKRFVPGVTESQFKSVLAALESSADEWETNNVPSWRHWSVTTDVSMEQGFRFTLQGRPPSFATDSEAVTNDPFDPKAPLHYIPVDAPRILVPSALSKKKVIEPLDISFSKGAVRFSAQWEQEIEPSEHEHTQLKVQWVRIKHRKTFHMKMGADSSELVSGSSQEHDARGDPRVRFDLTVVRAAPTEYEASVLEKPTSFEVEIECISPSASEHLRDEEFLAAICDLLMENSALLLGAAKS